jgi:hypothetical protein
LLKVFDIEVPLHVNVMKLGAEAIVHATLVLYDFCSHDISENRVAFPSIKNLHSNISAHPSARLKLTRVEPVIGFYFEGKL